MIRSLLLKSLESKTRTLEVIMLFLVDLAIEEKRCISEKSSPALSSFST